MNFITFVIIIGLLFIVDSNHRPKIKPWSQEHIDEIQEMFRNIKTQEDYDKATYRGIRK